MQDQESRQKQKIHTHFALQYTKNAHFDSRIDHTVKTRDILTYHYIEIRYFYYNFRSVLR